MLVATSALGIWYHIPKARRLVASSTSKTIPGAELCICYWVDVSCSFSWLVQPKSHTWPQLQGELKTPVLWVLPWELQQASEQYSTGTKLSDSLTNVPGAQILEHGCCPEPRLHPALLLQVPSRGTWLVDLGWDAFPRLDLPGQGCGVSQCSWGAAAWVSQCLSLCQGLILDWKLMLDTHSPGASLSHWVTIRGVDILLPPPR